MIEKRLVILDGPGKGSRYPLEPGTYVAGREPECGVYMPSRRVSRKHARFIVEPDRCVVQDMGSANGMLVNGHKMDACELVDGTRVQLGDVLIVYQCRDMPAQPEPLAPSPTPGVAGGKTMGFEMADLQEPAEEAPFGGPSPFGGGAFGAPEVEPAPFGGGGGGGFGQPVDEPGPEPTGPAPAGPSPGPSPAGEATSPAIHQGPPPPSEPAAARPAPLPGGLTIPESVPWLARLGALLLVAALVLFCGPIGGFAWMGWGADETVEDMALQQGVLLAQGLGHRNAHAIGSRQHLALDAEFVLDEPGVKQALLLDTQGDVVAPANKVNTSLRNDELFERAESERAPVYDPEDGYFRIIVPVRGEVTSGAPKTHVGYAVLTYDATTIAHQQARFSLRVLASILWMLVALAVVFGGVWLIAARPLAVLADETELAMKNGGKVVPPAGWPEARMLVHTINRALSRAKGEVVDDHFGTLFAACTFPVYVLDRNCQVVATNDWGAHLAGRPQEQVIGQRVAGLFADAGASDRIAAMIQGVESKQAPVLADRFVLGGAERGVTLAADAKVEHMVLVVQA
ncbi:MAG: FHA domain-containing protein [Proteobacteria bacterium]|nr:FHA domain-containing protein [Pseudomonadota bacterium]MCP4920793.1 FHA domain-containing protein [Pseudomonadota bacterium]